MKPRRLGTRSGSAAPERAPARSRVVSAAKLAGSRLRLMKEAKAERDLARAQLDELREEMEVEESPPRDPEQV